MRLFIAIHLSQEIKETLIDLQNDWYDLGVRGNYSSEENLHLTLAFIGEYSDPMPVMDALQCVTFAPIPLQLEGLLRRASVDKIPPVSFVPSSMTVDTISLMRSDRGKDGMIYTEVGSIQARLLDSPISDDVTDRREAFERLEKMCKGIPDIDEKKELGEHRDEKYGQ